MFVSVSVDISCSVLIKSVSVINYNNLFLSAEPTLHS